MAKFQNDYEALRVWQAKVEAAEKDFATLPQPLQHALRRRMCDTVDYAEMMTPDTALREIVSQCVYFIEADEEGEMDDD